MTIVEALKKLYAAFGGKASDVDNIDTNAELINAIADLDVSGGDSLPTVTTTDNGKVLSVVEGAWNKADIPTELPPVTSSDSGKVLTVNSNGNWAAESIDYIDDWITCTVSAGTAAISVSNLSAKFSPSRNVVILIGRITVTDLSVTEGSSILLATITVPNSADVSHMLLKDKSAAVTAYLGGNEAPVQLKYNVASSGTEITLNMNSSSSVTLSTYILIGALQV